MLKSVEYRLYPTKLQVELLDKHFGCARFIYNWALDKKINYLIEDDSFNTGGGTPSEPLEMWAVVESMKEEYQTI